MRPPLAAVVTISDRCSRGQAEDLSGPALVRLSSEHLGAHTLPLRCIPDEIPQITGTLQGLASMENPPDLILTTGGTGLAPRDVTPEATLAVIQRRHSGLMEMIRAECSRITPRVYLSRGEAGVCNRSLIINLPGSVRGATESFEAVLPILSHAIETLRGEVQDDGRPGTAARTGRVIEHED